MTLPSWFDDFREDYFLDQFYTGSRYLILTTRIFGVSTAVGSKSLVLQFLAWTGWIFRSRRAWRRVGSLHGGGGRNPVRPRLQRT